MSGGSRKAEPIECLGLDLGAAVHRALFQTYGGKPGAWVEMNKITSLWNLIRGVKLRRWLRMLCCRGDEVSYLGLRRR